MKGTVRIGSRKSKLAVWQAEYVSKQLETLHKIQTRIIPIRSKGDKMTHLSFEKMEGKGFFTKELDDALLDHEIDIAVHSLKDVPTEYPAGLAIFAVTKREDPRDVLIAKGKSSLKKLPLNSMIATGSIRRRSQLLAYRDDLKIVSLRGNIQTRFEKFYRSDWAGMILAAVGVDRLGLGSTISERISTDIMLPSVGQGSLAVMGKKEDEELQEICSPLEDKNSAIVSTAERSFLKGVGGGCNSPIACYGKIEKDTLVLQAFIGNEGGTRSVKKDEISGSIQKSQEMGSSLAKNMLTRDAQRFHENHKIQN